VFATASKRGYRRKADEGIPWKGYFAGARRPNEEALGGPPCPVQSRGRADLAKVWGVDVETIRNIFRDEPGVLKIGEKNPKHRRAYLTLRIPESVAVRVHKRLSE